MDAHYPRPPFQTLNINLLILQLYIDNARGGGEAVGSVWNSFVKVDVKLIEPEGAAPGMSGAPGGDTTLHSKMTQ